MHLNPEFMWCYFNENPIPYNLRKGIKVFLPLVKSFRLGFNFAHFRGSTYGITFLHQLKIVKL